MNKFRPIKPATQCQEFCPVLVTSESFKRGYCDVANHATKYLAELLLNQSLGKPVEIDADFVAALEDDLASLLNEEGVKYE